MKVTLSDAAKLVGTVTKDGIYKAFKRGTLSCEKNPSTGQWEIDIAELQRVYDLRQDDSVHRPTQRAQTESVQTSAELKALQDRLEWVQSDLNARLEMVSAERDDLRRRLDIESEERRGLQKLLTHQSENDGRDEIMRRLDESERERREIQRLLSERNGTPVTLIVMLSVLLLLILLGSAIFLASGARIF